MNGRQLAFIFPSPKSRCAAGVPRPRAARKARFPPGYVWTWLRNPPPEPASKTEPAPPVSRPKPVPRAIVRFVARLKLTPRGCLEWTGYVHRGGYGYSGPRAAHRKAWQLVNGPIPAGLQICHRCDNRVCCLPSHMFLGTAKDNSDDAVAKGRDRRGKQRGVRNLPPADRAELVRLALAGEPRPALAERFNLSERNVYYILAKHRPSEPAAAAGVPVGAFVEAPPG